MNIRPLHNTFLTLVIIGAINWGLWGLFQLDLVAAIFDGQTGGFSRVIYTIVGLAGLGLIYTNSQIKTRQIGRTDADRFRPAA